MPDLGGERHHLLDGRARPIGFAVQPKAHRQIGLGHDATILTETERELLVPLGIVMCRRLFEMGKRASNVTLSEPPGHALHAMGNTSECRIRPCFGGRQSRLGGLPHERCVAAHVAAGPQAIES